MDELARQFATLAEKFGPLVSSAAIGAARMNAYSRLAESLIWAGTSVAFVLAGRALLRRVHVNDEDDIAPASFLAYLAFFIAAFLILSALWAWIDPWTWTAIVHPEVWLAKRAFGI